MQAGHWKRARAAVESLAKTNPNDARTLYLLSRVKLAFRDYDSALQLAEKAVALDDKNANFHRQLGEVCGDMTDAPGVGMFKKMSLGKRFKNENEKALALDPKLFEARFALIDFYMEAPGMLGGSKSEAQRIANEVAQIDPVQGFLAQANLALEKKEFASAEQFFLKAARADPHAYGTRINLANIYMSDAQKKYDLAEKYALEAQKIDPGRSGSYTALASVYASQSRWTDLDAILAKAEKNSPDDFTPCYQAGKTLLLQGNDLPRAERYFRKYLTQEPEGQAPDFAAAHWRLGLVLENQGHENEAIAELEKSLQLKPDFEPAKKDLKRLK